MFYRSKTAIRNIRKLSDVKYWNIITVFFLGYIGFYIVVKKSNQKPPKCQKASK